MLMYVQSEAEFSRASHQGLWEVVRGLITRHNPYLLCFNDVVARLRPRGVVAAGLQNIPAARIVGSAGRHQNFTRHFLPRSHDQRSRERWRNIFTLAITGAGFPPIEVYQVGDDYYVEDGHHRVSVVKYLRWETIQAYVTQLLVTDDTRLFTGLDTPGSIHCQN